jgi:VPDSG-CTERM motif
LGGTNLIISFNYNGQYVYNSGQYVFHGETAMIYSTINNFSGVPDAGSSLGLLGLALSGLMAFRLFIRQVAQ